MGLKDWFGGKKSQYRDKVKEAVSDGTLTRAKIEELEALRKELDAEPISEDRTTVRREAFNAAVDAVKSGGKLTSSEEGELARIQKFLALRDDQVDKTRLEVRRLKTVTEISEGRLPVVSPENSVLRGLKLEPEEIPHYSAAADLLECRDPGDAQGVKVTLGEPYRFGSADGADLPMDRAEQKDTGFFLLTSRRILFKGSRRTFGHDFHTSSDINLYRDGLRLKTMSNHLLLKFRADGVSDVVATLMSQLKK